MIALPRPLILFGLAGLLPQMLCALMVVQGGPERWFALAAACCYGAVILSFLGGLWWMAALLGGLQSPLVYALAIAPSLVGWSALLPWCVGWPWPVPSLAVLSMGLLLSPAVDIYLSRQMPASLPLSQDWLRLRITMASGLGLLTIAIAAV